MIYQIKIQKIGGSLFIRLDRAVQKLLSLNEGDYCLVDVKSKIKKEEIEKEISLYRCVICNYEWSTDATFEDNYCSCCGNEEPSSIIKLKSEENSNDKLG